MITHTDYVPIQNRYGGFVFAGGTMQDVDGPARELALEAGNQITTLDAAQSAVWAEAAQPVYEAWIADMADKGRDGQALIDEARALMDEYTAAN